MPHALGIDFGGTKILAGVVDTDSGKVLGSGKKRTRKSGSAVMDRLFEAADEAIKGSGLPLGQIEAVGIGVAGQVDRATGALVRAPNLPDELLGMGIIHQVQSKLGRPVHIFNDVVAAAAGEAAFGAGKGYPDFVCIFVGTGIGGAIYRDSKPYFGATNTAGELGHMVIETGGRLCRCGGQGHLEAYASRTAVVATILGGMRQGRSSVLSQLVSDPSPDQAIVSPIRSKALAEAVRQEDALTIEMIQEGARYLGSGLVSIINFYNPPRIVVGGGMVDAVDLYFNLAAAHAQAQALLVPRQHVEIVKSGLGDYSGVVGAAVLACELPAAVPV